MKDFKIVSVGEILFDCYPDVKHLGGAPFNFICHINKLTGSGDFISGIGEDKDGKEITGFLRKNNLNTEFLQTDPQHPTGKVNVKLDDKAVPDFNIVENCAYDFIKNNENISGAAAQSDLLYFGTLAQRNTTSRGTIQSLKELSRQTFVDLNIRQNYYSPEIIFNSIKNCSVLKVNGDEYNLIKKTAQEKSMPSWETEQEFLQKFGIGLLCITYGDKGSTLFTEGEINRVETPETKVVDTVGAGDAFSAVLAIGYLKKWPLEKINRLAGKFAAEICGYSGALPDNDEFYAKYKSVINEK